MKCENCGSEHIVYTEVKPYNPVWWFNFVFLPVLFLLRSFDLAHTADERKLIYSLILVFVILLNAVAIALEFTVFKSRTKATCTDCGWSKKN